MFSIGEFSKITGLTVKTLRYYHERGLLTPAWVDQQTGYRFYGPTQVEKARVINQLREMEFSLDEIDAILRDCDVEANLLDFLERQKTELEGRVRRYRDIVACLDKLILHEKEARITMQKSTFVVEEKMLEPMLIAAVRMKGKYSDCGKGFARIGRKFGRHIVGKCLLLHHDTEYREEADFEACFPIRQGKDVDGISVRELPGGRCVSLLHKGPYEELGRSYAKILEFIKEKRYEVILPTREIYVKGPGMIFRGNPKNYLTEIQMLVKQHAMP
jgi:DNA-binding transcriptional MerR regulator